MHKYRDEELAQALSELPVPPTSDDFFARLRAQIPRTEPLRTPRRRLVATAVLVGLALLVGGVAGAELAGPSRGATSPPFTSFQPALGWNTFETNVLADPTQPDVTWAANVPFKPESLETPVNTIKSLPPDGIVILVTGPGSYTGSEHMPDLSLPATLSQFYFHGDNYEGHYAPNVSYYFFAGHVSETEAVDFEVWMGRNDPTPAMKAAADKELDRLTLPS
jgi:hypothetical protein